MSFTSEQTAALRAKLRRRHVKTRTLNGRSLSFLEGWHVIAEANRIFGFDGWDRRTRTPRCVWSRVSSDGHTAVLYTTTVQVTVRANESSITRDGVGTGFARACEAEIAHDIALKAAETDATKRALATFGNPFGLALYDKSQKCVTRPGRSLARSNPPRAGDREAVPALRFTLHTNDGAGSYQNERDWLAAAHQAAAEIGTLSGLYTFWNANKIAFKQIRLSPLVTTSMVEGFIEALKVRARALGRSPLPKPAADKQSALLIPKEKRFRCKSHLAFVRTLPCVVCGRQPSHAHHIKFAQQGALGLKVSDEFTVPLCYLHHDALHQVGNERAWWATHSIDPLTIAADLWRSTRGTGEEPSSAPLLTQAAPPSPEQDAADPSQNRDAARPLRLCRTSRRPARGSL